MSDVQSLNHSKWECKYHMTWIPKCRRKILYGELRKYLGEVFKDLARRKECEILEGDLMEDHVHMHVVPRRQETRWGDGPPHIAALQRPEKRRPDKFVPHPDQAEQIAACLRAHLVRPRRSP